MSSRPGSFRKPLRIGFYGNFGAGNLGNECTLRAAIDQILLCRPDAQLLCFCTNPSDVRARHGINAFPSEAVDRMAAERSGLRRPRDALVRVFRILFQRTPLELVHWIKSLLIICRTDMLIVAGTGIVADYMTGPLGWPYDIFKLSVLAAICRVELVFLSVGVGPINHRLSRWFLSRSLALASYRSYRDEASKQYLKKIGIDVGQDFVIPDLVFSLVEVTSRPAAGLGHTRVVGLGLKDYGGTERLGPDAFREYLDAMASFVSWLQQSGYGVRLLIGDVQYDTCVTEEFIDVLKQRNVPTNTPLLMAEPAKTVDELLRQVSETDAVISPRYHNLVMALTQNKPVIALSDHPKLQSLMTELGLAEYHISLRNLSQQDLIGKFEALDRESGRLKSYIKAKVENYRKALRVQCATIVAAPNRTLQTIRRTLETETTL